MAPFLPGDSLLFAAGALAASSGAFNMWILVPLLIVAAVLGDAVNYAVGRRRRPAGVHGRRSHQLVASPPQSRPPGEGACVLREVRRQGHRPRPLRADRADVRAVRRRRRHHDLRHVRALQRGRRRDLGRHLHDRRITRSATSRSCATTSRSSRSASSPSRFCRWSWRSCGTGAQRSPRDVLRPASPRLRWHPPRIGSGGWLAEPKLRLGSTAAGAPRYRVRAPCASYGGHPSPGIGSEGWWTAGGSNSRPLRCERSALPAELAAPGV